MDARIFAATALIFCAIAQVDSSPMIDTGRHKNPYHREIGTLYLLLVAPNGTECLLSPKEVLSLKSKLLTYAEEMILYRVTDENRFSHLLSDHQIERLLDFQVIAVVSHDETEILKQPGFGHRLIILEKNGVLKSFMFKMTLDDAVRQLPQDYPYNFSTSKNAYHTAFQDKMKVPIKISRNILQ